MNKLFLSFFLLGLSFGMGPCLASCGPLLISYVSGTGKNIRQGIKVYFLFSLSRISVYLVLGLLIFWLGQQVSEMALGGFSRYLYLIGGLFIIFLGVLIMLGKNTGHQFCRNISNTFLKGDTKTALLLGAVIGILPCAPLIALISYIGLVSRHWIEVIRYSIAFGLGTILSPLFILIVFAGLMQRILVSRIFNLICGAIIIYLGAQLLFRGFYA